MCKYCTFNGNGMAEEVLLMTTGGEHTFIEEVDDTHQITSYRNNLDLPYVSFKIKYCPKCGREFNKPKKSNAAKTLDMLGVNF